METAAASLSMPRGRLRTAVSSSAQPKTTNTTKQRMANAKAINANTPNTSRAGFPSSRPSSFVDIVPRAPLLREMLVAPAQMQ